MIINNQTGSPEGPSDYNRTYVWGIAFVAAMGGLLFGYDWVVIGGAKPFFQSYFQLRTPARSAGPTAVRCWAAWRGRWWPEP